MVHIGEATISLKIDPSAALAQIDRIHAAFVAADEPAGEAITSLIIEDDDDNVLGVERSEVSGFVAYIYTGHAEGIWLDAQEVRQVIATLQSLLRAS